MLYRVQSAAVFGIQAYLISVEVDFSLGRRLNFLTVGLPDTAVRESSERVKAALRNHGFDLPPQHITVDRQELLTQSRCYSVDYRDVRGQYQAKRALEVATAGGHNILMLYLVQKRDRIGPQERARVRRYTSPCCQRIATSPNAAFGASSADRPIVLQSKVD